MNMKHLRRTGRVGKFTCRFAWSPSHLLGGDAPLISTYHDRQERRRYAAGVDAVGRQPYRAASERGRYEYGAAVRVPQGVVDGDQDGPGEVLRRKRGVSEGVLEGRFGGVLYRVRGVL